MFDEPTKLLLGFITGLAFGFLLQKGQVGKFRVIVGQLLLRDWTVVKIMGTAVAVGTVGVNLLVSQGLAEIHIQEAVMGRIIPGAILFGIGMAVLGLCPGTGVAACGQGDRDAFVGVGGMFSGALLYVGLFPALQGFFKASGSWGKVTVAQLLGASSLPVALALASAIGLIIAILYSQRRQHHLLIGGSS